jgi:hypothetical protein
MHWIYLSMHARMFYILEGDKWLWVVQKLWEVRLRFLVDECLARHSVCGMCCMCAYCILNTYDLTLRSRALSINDYFYVFHQTETVFDGVNMLACTNLSLQNKFLSLLGGAKPFECGRTYSYLENTWCEIYRYTNRLQHCAFICAI